MASDPANLDRVAIEERLVALEQASAQRTAALRAQGTIAFTANPAPQTNAPQGLCPQCLLAAGFVVVRRVVVTAIIGLLLSGVDQVPGVGRYQQS